MTEKPTAPKPCRGYPLTAVGEQLGYSTDQTKTALQEFEGGQSIDVGTPSGSTQEEQK
jgi:hypothetical protein